MKTKLLVFLFLTVSIIPNLIYAQFTQQGLKLVGTGGVGIQEQGFSVGISSDGNTSVIGGWQDSNDTGAVWIFTRTNGIWSQQGSKLVGTGGVGGINELIYQGWAVAISADGNTVVVGAPVDNVAAGAIWVFTRTAGVWSQQGSKLVATGESGSSELGFSVAISGDGNTIISGGSLDNGHAGAVWVYTRTAGVWTQQGSKLIGTGAIGTSWQGWSVAASSDGNTMVEGGYLDNNNTGAIWTFTRSGGVWTQQGSKLVGTGSTGTASQGASVSLSSDGNTAVTGGYTDNNNAGALWVFSRSGSVWSQQGSKLTGTGAFGNAIMGNSVSISPDGKTIIAGGLNDDSLRGAVWAFYRNGTNWNQLGPKLIGTGASGIMVYQGCSLSISSNGTVIEGGYGDNAGVGATWVFTNPSIGITPISNEIPKYFNLSQNYPNPFNPNTKIKFQIPNKGLQPLVQIIVLDILGREVSTLVNEQLKPGTYEVDFDGTKLSSGVYFYKLITEDFSEAKQMVLLK